MNLDPPPSTVKLVTNEYDPKTKMVSDKSMSNSIWTLWIYNLFSFLSVENWREIDATDEPAFENNWANYTTSSSFNTAAFYKDPFGLVHLKGLVEDTVGTGVGATIFTLPVDYRTTKSLIFAAIATGNTVARIDVNSSGTVSLVGGDGSDFLSLDGISFRAAQR